MRRPIRPSLLRSTALTALAALHPPARSALAVAATHAADLHEPFMRAALAEAAAAFEADEVPIGAVLVRDGAIVAAAHNQVERLQDASAHAEMLCMREAAAAATHWRLSEATLYCTIEPCPMCLAALHAFRVGRLVYGAPNPRMGAVESALRLAADVPHPYHELEVTGGVLADDAGELMRSFFRRRREQGPYVPPAAAAAAGDDEDAGGAAL